MTTQKCIIFYSCLLLLGIKIYPSSSASTTTPLSSTIMTTGSTITPADYTYIGSTEVSTNTPTTTATTAAVIQCFNGTCAGNASDETDYSCVNTTGMCELADGGSCFITVFKNSSIIVFDVGCKSNCEYLQEEGEGTNTMSTTECCTTHLCNNQRLNDPDNSAVSMTSSLFVIVCVLVLFI